MHRHFDEEIVELRQKLVLMGGLAESMIQHALRMLVERRPMRSTTPRKSSIFTRSPTRKG